MVFFTCNHCGESVKKAAVEKHYFGRCRGAPKSVSCMDCMKDFYGEEYVAHTKCITEKQKYSGKDYVHKEPLNSNAKKQETWMDIVRSILDTAEYNLDGKTRAAFERLETLDNVPRKKAKFINFANSCLRMYKPIVQNVWNVLEKELEKMKQAKAAELEAKKLAQQKAKQEKENVAEVNDNNVIGGEPTAKKKKTKVKHEESSVDDSTETPQKKSKLNGTTAEETQLADVDVTKRKKCKKSKENGVANEASVIATNGDCANAADDFDWSSVIEKIVAKHAEGITIAKLQKKLLKKYLAKLAVDELTEKQHKKFEKKFGKMLKKCPAAVIDGEVIKLC